MNKKHLIAICIIGIIISAVSFTTGRLTSTKTVYNTTTYPKESSVEIPSVTEAVQTSEPVNSAYTIILNNSMLRLCYGNDILRETYIAPDVLPVADITALTEGIAYDSEEKALIEWESLCN